MNANKLILASLVIFLAGMVAGSAVSALRTKAGAKAEREKREQVSSPSSYRLDFLRRVQKELQLSDEQKIRIEGYIRESQSRLRALWEPLAPQAKSEYESLKEKIRGELNAQQLGRFNEILRDRNRRGENREKRPDESGQSRSTEPKHSDAK